MEPIESGPPLVFDHIGIVVDDLEKGVEELRALLGAVEWTPRFDDENLRVSVRFARDTSGIVYELIAPLGESSPIARVARSRTNLLNQIAYRTSSLEESVRRLRRTNHVPLGPALPAVAFGGAPVQFLVGSLGFVIELIEIDRVVHQFSDEY